MSRPSAARALDRLAAAGALGAVALAGHACLNAHLLRRPPTPQDRAAPRVSVLLPLRDEAHRVRPCLRALRAQRDGGRAQYVVLDDASTDGTADVVRDEVGDDPRFRLVAGTPPPPGWLGKPWACHQLAGHADPAADVLVFVDADVVLAPDAVAATAALLDTARLDLVSPYPQQQAIGPAERLVQPLLQWSWLTFLPLRAAEGSGRPSMAAANGQLLAVRGAAYDRVGGHAAVRAAVLDDVALLRAVIAAGGRGGVADGTEMATCRMYDGWPALRDGYTKSLWAATSGPVTAAVLGAGLALLYLVPPIAAVATRSRWGAAGYAAAVAGRVVTARRTGGRAWPDAAAHPASVAVFLWLLGRSWHGRRAGTLTWKGRAV